MAKKQYELKGHVPVYGPKSNDDVGAYVGWAIFILFILICLSQCSG